MEESTSPSCNGYRLNEKARSVKVNKLQIGEVTRFSITEANQFLSNLSLTSKEEQIARLILK